MTTTSPSDGDNTPTNPWTCRITSDGDNTPRAVAADDAMPVVLRDPIPDRRQFERFGCDVRDDSPATPDRVEPDVAFTLGVHSNARVRMPDGRRVDFMSFHHWVGDDEDDDATEDVFPAPLLRVRQGQVVHTTLVPSRNTHTIHHHGIEPTPHNDGVGHTSFEVADSYTYQWRASSAGTFFYHCHKNTPLHFELGMYGALVVDPPTGPGTVHRGRTLVGYDHEALWITDDVDPRWHDLDHQAGIEACPFDTSQHLLGFHPAYWLLSGVPHPDTRSDPRVAVRCRSGERVLVRLLNAAYAPVHVTLPFDAEVVNVDGHPLGTGHDERYSRPFRVPAGTPLVLTTAQRHDLLVVPDRVGVFDAVVRFGRWPHGVGPGLVETTFTVGE